jgi:magnesium chelatase accessory protein
MLEGYGPLVWERDGACWPNCEASLFVDAGGLRWHVQRMGDADAPQLILLLHGTGAATHSWRALAPLLARDAQVVAPDLPGHGFSSAPGRDSFSLPGMARAVAALLRALDISPTVVVGHSAGAAIGARLCLDGAIAPGTLIGINGAWLPFGGPAARFFSPAARILADSPMAAWLVARSAREPGLARRLLDGTGSRIDDVGARAYARLLRSPAHIAGALAMMAHWELGPLLRELPSLAPHLLLLAGAADRTVSQAQSAQVARSVAGARLEILPGLGHLAHEEAPEMFAARILAATSPAAASHTPP